MENTYWLKQSPDKPLFPDLLWSRPETKTQAGKLLIVGGHKHAFAAPASAYGAAQKAGIGSIRVLLPNVLKRTLGPSFAEAEFASSTPSGSFSRQALVTLLELAEWSDGLLLAGDLGRNSETAILLEKLLQKYSGQLTCTDDSLNYFLDNGVMTSRRHNAIVIETVRLQKLAKNNRPSTPILHRMNLHELITVLADWTTSTPALFITKHADNFVVASGGKVSTTPTKDLLNWQVELAAYVAAWLIQQPRKTFEAISTAVYDFVTKAT